MGFVIICDASASVSSVIFAAGKFKSLLTPAADLMSLLEDGSRQKFTHFLQTIWQQGSAVQWEVFFELENEPKFLTLNGYKNSDSCCIVAAENSDGLRELTETYCRDRELFLKTQEFENSPQPTSLSSARPDQVLFDDIGVLYAEMATLQRELSKKQVELEKMNKTIGDYAANLELMVAEKTNELSASEAKFRGVFENSSLGIAIADLSGHIITCNDALRTIIGLHAGGSCVSSMQEIFFNENRSQFADIMSKLKGGLVESEEVEKRIIQGADPEKWVNINIFTLQLKDSEQVNIIYIVEEITGRKQNELALLQSEKLTAIGKLAASLAHEINNPLQAVMGYLGLAAESLNSENPVSEYLDIASDELKRISVIVSDLRAASRKPQIKEKKPSDIKEVVQRVINLTRKKASENNINVVHQLQVNLPLVVMNSEQIQQVILNLVMNSIESIGENGEIRITAVVSKTGNGAEVIVEDNGPGIQPEVMGKVFGPFFTTKKEGLGLGLHLSRDIIEAHGGKITAANRKPGGAIFSIWLPYA